MEPLTSLLIYNLLFFFFFVKQQPINDSRTKESNSLGPDPNGSGRPNHDAAAAKKLRRSITTTTLPFPSLQTQIMVSGHTPRRGMDETKRQA